MQQHGYYRDDAWNKSDFIYTFETGSRLEFFSADQPSKVRGPRRDRLFVNEANNVPYEAFDQLEVRTKSFIYCDWNPTNEFWFYTDIIGKRDDAELIILTYKDNEALDPNIVASIEQRRANINWWKVYGEGQLGVTEGRIFKDWKIIDEIPHEARIERIGLDFGYTNDPSAAVDIYKYNGGFIVDERIYQKGMSNKQIADILLNDPKSLVKADSSEPKSIDEIRLHGVLIMPALKGVGSVNSGIQFVQNQKISVTKRSVNIIKEFRNYMWMTDRDGRIINVPMDAWNHAMDAIRYGMEDFMLQEKEEENRYRQPEYEPQSIYEG